MCHCTKLKLSIKYFISKLCTNLFSYQFSIYQMFTKCSISPKQYIKILRRSLLKLQTSHRRVQTTADEWQKRVTDDYRRVTDDYRRVPDDYRRAIEDYRRVTNNYKQVLRRVTDDYIRFTPKVLLNTFTKHYFQKGYGFPNALMKKLFLLKEGKLKKTLLDNKSDNFKFLTSFSLDIRAW